MKKTLNLFLSILIILTAVSCSKETVALSKHVSTAPIPISGIKLPTDVQSLAVYKNVAFTLTDGEVFRYDIMTGEKLLLTTDTDAQSIGCNGYYLAVVGSHNISVYDYDGNAICSYPHNIKDLTVADVAVNNDTVVLLQDNNRFDSIHTLDIKSGKVKKLPDDWKPAKEVDVFGISLNENGMLSISSSYDFSFSGFKHNLCKYKLSNGKLVYTADTSESSFRGCFGADGEFYYVDSFNQSYKDGDYYIEQFIRKFDKEEAFFNDYLLVDNASIHKMGFGPVDGMLLNIPELGITDSATISDQYYLEYSDGDSFVIYNKTAATLVAFTRDTSLEPIVIIMPGSRQSFNNSFRYRTARYTALTGRQVEIRNYDTQSYQDGVRTKIMAQDSDFDLFIADSYLLSSLLANSAYEPLDSYEGIADNFDEIYAKGMKSLMSSDKGIFGIPLSMHISGSQKVVDDTVTYPINPTLGDFYALCDSLDGTGKKALESRLLLTQMTNNLLEEMVATEGRINEATLAEFLSKLKYYNDKGVLCDGDSPHVLEFGSKFFVYDGSGALAPVDTRTVHAPIAGDTVYININKVMMLNSASKNKDAAAEFLELLSSEDVVYSNLADDSYHYLFGRDIEKNVDYPQMTEDERNYASYCIKLFENSKLAGLDTADRFMEFLRDDIFAPLFDGKITPEKASEEINYRIAYTYFE